MTPEINATIGTIMGAGVLYVLTEILKWVKSIRSNKVINKGVNELLETNKKFHSDISNEINGVKNDIKEIKKELTYNGGSSLKDQINEMKGLQEARFFTQQNQQSIPIFNCDKHGQCTFSNSSLSDLFGMHYSEMLGKGWLRAIGETQADREAVYEDWMNAVKNDIPFERDYLVINRKTGDRVKCKAKAEPQRKKDGEIMFYLGTVQKL